MDERRDTIDRHQGQGTSVAVLAGVCLASFIVSFAIGRYPIGPITLMRILLGRILPIARTWSDQMEIVVFNIRLPRIIGAGLIGAALSAAGCIYQGMFRNPMAAPDILGSSAGAGFGAALAIMASFGYLGICLSAFTFGLLAVMIAYFAASRYRQDPALGLILAGIMVGSLFSAGTSFLKLVADPTDQLPAITYWLMGSLASLRKQDIYLLLPLMIVGLVPMFLLRWRINVLTLGDDEAKALGVDTRLLRGLLIALTTLITSASVAVSGMIGWVGLVIPHLARKLTGNDFRLLLPGSMLAGAAFLILVDDLARTMTTSEIPIGILTAFVGAPFFLHLILKNGRKSS